MTDTQTPNRSGDFSVAYNQLCTSYHAIDDFRAKLLGFLPLVTGGGLVLLTGLKKDVRQEFFAPMGFFGILVTLGLLIYELFGIKRCQELIKEGEKLEKEMFESGKVSSPTGVINSSSSASRSPLRLSTRLHSPRGCTWRCTTTIPTPTPYAARCSAVAGLSGGSR
jgi:hypothetical protein